MFDVCAVQLKEELRHQAEKTSIGCAKFVARWNSLKPNVESGEVGTTANDTLMFIGVLGKTHFEHSQFYAFMARRTLSTHRAAVAVV